MCSLFVIIMRKFPDRAQELEEAWYLVDRFYMLAAGAGLECPDICLFNFAFKNI